MNDLRLAFRRLCRSPRFAVATALTLAVGVGGAAGIFALVDAVLLRPLPYPEPDRLVAITHTAPGLGLAEAGHSFGTYHHYRDQAQALQDFAIYSEGVVELSDGGEPERVHVASVTHSFFSTLGVAPALGRSFVPGDGMPDTPEVVILGHGLWVRRYGADPGIVGRTVELNRAAREVVGVMPQGFGFPRPETEVWGANEFAARAANLEFLQLTGIARLTPSASPESAARELNMLIPRLADAYGDVTPATLAEARLAARVEPLHAAMLGDLAGVLWLVLAATALVLAIAAANVANLFLVRAEERRLEIAVRAALGAGSAERIRTFLAEGIVLGVIAGVLAVPLAAALVQGVVALGPTDLPRMHEVGFGARHGFVTLGISLLLGLVLSAVPALRGMVHAGGTSSLRVDQRLATGPAQRRVMQLLTVGEIAVGFTLLAGAALLLQSFQRLRNVDPGFDAESVLTMEIALPARPYRGEERTFWRTLVERIEALPGVDAAGVAALLPLTTGVSSEDWLSEPVLVEHASPSVEAPPMAPFLSVTPGYFEALRMTVLAGEAPTSWSATGHVAVVNSSFARRFLGERNPLGARVRPDAWREVPWHTVTAVVADVRGDGLAADPAPVVYVPVAEGLGEPAYPPRHMSLAIRTSVPPLTLAGAVRAVVHDIDPKLPIAGVRTMEDIVARATAPARFTMLALTLAAVVALFLSAVGTYGLVAYAVSRRTHEIGVRIALGASAMHVRRLVLRQGAVLALAGVAAGLGAMLGLGQVLQSLLFEMRASDPATLTAASLFLIAVVLLAVDVPARRAARVDPLVALRTE
ncbi:MAG: ABC transporter permease [Gemmatimonadales bacterium]